MNPTATLDKDGTIVLTTSAGEVWRLDWDSVLDSDLPSTLLAHLNTLPAAAATATLEALADTITAEVKRQQLNRQLAEQLAERMPNARITANGVLITPASSEFRPEDITHCLRCGEFLPRPPTEAEQTLCPFCADIHAAMTEPEAEHELHKLIDRWQNDRQPPQTDSSTPPTQIGDRQNAD